MKEHPTCKKLRLWLGFLGVVGAIVFLAFYGLGYFFAMLEPPSDCIYDARFFSYICLGFAFIAFIPPVPFGLWRVSMNLSIALLIVVMCRELDHSAGEFFQRVQLTFGAAIGILILLLWKHDSNVSRFRWLVRLAPLTPLLLAATCWASQYCFGWRPLSFQFIHPTMRDWGGTSLEQVPQASPSSGSSMAKNIRLGVTSPGGNLHAKENQDREIVLEGKSGQFLLVAEKGFYVLVFSPDGRILVGLADPGGKEKALYVWDIEGGLDGNSPPGARLRYRQNVPTPTTYYQVPALAIAPDNDTIALSNDDGVQFLSIASRQITRRFIPHYSRKWGWPSKPFCVAYSEDGAMLATWSLDDIKLWHYPSLELYRTLRPSHPSGSVGCSLAFAPDSKTLIAVDRERSCEWSVSPNWWVLGLLATASAGLIVLLATDRISARPKQ